MKSPRSEAVELVEAVADMNHIQLLVTVWSCGPILKFFFSSEVKD